MALRPNRLSNYLSRSIWPFLASLLASVVFMLVLVPLMFGGFIAAGLVSSNGYGTAPY